MKDTLVVFQCCKRKKIHELFPIKDIDLVSMLPTTGMALESYRTEFIKKGVIDSKSSRVTALSLYDGHFYSVPKLKATVAKALSGGVMDFLIMSAAYGFTHPFERIHVYEQEMKGKVTHFWLNKRLPSILGEYIQVQGFQRVYGFFSKSADYQKIFRSIPWYQLQKVREAGFFFLDGIRGASKVLQALSRLFLNLLENRFTIVPTTWETAQVNYSPLKNIGDRS